jgi:hypothetical protein
LWKSLFARQFLQQTMILGFSSPRFLRRPAHLPATLPGHNLRCAFDVFRVFCAGATQKERLMSISSVGGAPALSQLYSAQQAQALSAVSVDALTDSTSDASGTQANNGNALTGTTTSNLDSQTLQALLDLTQQDPGTDPSQASQTGQAPAQAQGAHHRHHHGGGMMQAQSGNSPQASAMTALGNAPSLTAAADTGDDSSEASLASALMNA